MGYFFDFSNFSGENTYILIELKIQDWNLDCFIV